MSTVSNDSLAPAAVAADPVVSLPSPSAAGSQRETEKRTGRARLALRGSAWTIVEYSTVQLLRMAATLVLARNFLAPETFGIVGLVSVFINGLTMFSELGIMVNIVQHPRGNDPKFLRTAFSIQATRGLIIWGAAALAAYPLARFYQQPEVFALLMVVASSEVIRGLTSTAAWTLKRYLKLGKLAGLAISAEAMAFVVAILWAMASPSAWVLVARTLTAACVFAAGSHLIAGKAVSFGWDRSAASEILKFGKWISLSTAAYFLAGQGERLFLAKFITPAELGCFSLALAIASAPAAGLGQLVNQVFLPMISASVRSSQAETIRDFVRARQIFFVIGVIAAGGFLLCAVPFVSTLLKPEYSMTGWMLQALGLRVALDLFTAPVSSLLLAHGQSQYAAMGNTTRLFFMISGIWIAFAHFGIREAVVSLIVAQSISYLPLMIGLSKLHPEAGRAEFRWYGAFLALIVLGAIVAAGPISQT